MTGTGNPKCRLCELGGTARRTCIPTTGYSCVWPRSSSQALLVVGKAPGGAEDKTGLNFVGDSGHVLQNVYLGHEVPRLADLYFTNAVRCYLQAGVDAKPAHIKACRTYLEEDLTLLTAQYERVTIFCVGAVATESVLGMTLKKAMSHQGAENPPVFSTYHPAYIMYREGDDRKASKPQYIGAVGSHMALLRAHLEGRNVRSAWTTETPIPYLEPSYG